MYVRMKAKAAEEVGIQFKHVQVPETAEVSEIVNIVKALNEDDSISGILVQLPLGSHVGAEGERTVTEAVSPEKDVDGYVLFASERFSRGGYYVSRGPRERLTTNVPSRRSVTPKFAVSWSYSTLLNHLLQLPRIQHRPPFFARFGPTLHPMHPHWRYPSRRLDWR